MGFDADAEKWIEENLGAGGIAGAAERGAAIEAAGGGAVVAAGEAGGAALSAALGLPTTFAQPRAPTGKIITAVGRRMPNGNVIPIAMLPGRPVVMSTHIAVAKALKKFVRKGASAVGLKFTKAPKRKCAARAPAKK